MERKRKTAKTDSSKQRIINLGCTHMKEQGYGGFWTTQAMYTRHFGFNKLDFEKRIKIDGPKKTFLRQNQIKQYECFVITDKPKKSEIQIMKFLLQNIQNEEERTVVHR